MPIHDIQTKEYECSWCCYKWTNRFNGKDGPIPNNCAKCKRSNWNKGGAEAISPEENGLRRRIKGFNKLYYVDSLNYGDKKMMIEWPIDLSEKFLNIQPRPTIKEMIKVLIPLGFDTRKHRNYIPDTDRPDYLKYDSSQWVLDPDEPGTTKYNYDNEYKKLLKQEAQRRQEIMIEIMKSRGVEYDPIPIIKEQMKEHLREERNRKLELHKKRQNPEYIESSNR